MLNMKHAIVAGLALGLLPATAHAGTAQQTPVVPVGRAGMVSIPIVATALPPDARDLSNMPPAQAAAILVGGTAGGVVAVNLLGGGFPAVAGVVFGVMAGDAMYEKGYWPFR
jgi:hypothetical protein